MEFFATADEFEAGLEAKGADANEVPVRMAKKHTVSRRRRAGAVDVALCFGWIDGARSASTTTGSRSASTPRRPQSTWSKVGRQKVEALTARPDAAGRPAEIERPKADGRWQAAYDAW